MNKKYNQQKKEQRQEARESFVQYRKAVGMEFMLPGAVDDKRILLLYRKANEGISYTFFEKLVQSSNFTIKEWAEFLHLSERSLQRYKNDNKTLDSFHSERIIQITMLLEKGSLIFGDLEKFQIWLNAENLQFGRKSPKSFLTNSFGIQYLTDELTRIEHGILA